MNSISPNNNLSFSGIAPFAINEMRQNLKARGASIDEYDEFIKTLASDRSGDDFTIETRLSDGRSGGSFRVLNGKDRSDLGILYSLKDAVRYANSLADAKYAKEKDRKLDYLQEAQEVISPTLYLDYGGDGSHRIYENMKKSIGLDIEG